MWQEAWPDHHRPGSPPGATAPGTSTRKHGPGGTSHSPCSWLAQGDQASRPEVGSVPQPQTTCPLGKRGRPSSQGSLLKNEKCLPLKEKRVFRSLGTHRHTHRVRDGGPACLCVSAPPCPWARLPAPGVRPPGISGHLPTCTPAHLPQPPPAPAQSLGAPAVIPMALRPCGNSCSACAPGSRLRGSRARRTAAQGRLGPLCSPLAPSMCPGGRGWVRFPTTGPSQGPTPPGGPHRQTLVTTRPVGRCNNGKP